jgi:Ca2+-binding EF-hand superfamily protein
MPPMPPAAPPTGEPTGTAMPPAANPTSVTSHAPDSISSNYHVAWSALDKNGDGNISRSEVKASGNADLMREFHVVDANHNGRLSKEEMKGWTD